MFDYSLIVVGRRFFLVFDTMHNFILNPKIVPYQNDITRNLMGSIFVKRLNFKRTIYLPFRRAALGRLLSVVKGRNRLLVATYQMVAVGV
ncbi:hypothetical protein IV03_01195 [Pseudomonas congelans]|nr:hypothetical protein IV03_01195 [Pseudomonas congelans]